MIRRRVLESSCRSPLKSTGLFCRNSTHQPRAAVRASMEEVGHGSLLVVEDVLHFLCDQVGQRVVRCGV